MVAVNEAARQWDQGEAAWLAESAALHLANIRLGELRADWRFGCVE